MVFLCAAIAVADELAALRLESRKAKRIARVVNGTNEPLDEDITENLLGRSCCL